MAVAPWIQALLWGMTAGGALIVGAATGYLVKLPPRFVAGAMAFAAGVLIAALSLELMEDAFALGGFASTLLGFGAGAMAHTIAHLALSRRGAAHRKRSGTRQPAEAAQAGSGLAIAAGSLLDGLPEGVVIGNSVISGHATSGAIVLAVVLSNIPEGLSSASGMKNGGRSAVYIFGVWSAIAAAVCIASVVGHTVFSRFSDETIAVTNAFAAGAILAMLVDTMIPEAYEDAHDFSGFITVLGFMAAFVIVKAGE